MQVTAVVIEFSNFLNKAFGDICVISRRIEHDHNNIILADDIEKGFLQYMWESMVESQLCNVNESLETYGDGADYYGESSRVVFPERQATHRIAVVVTETIDLLTGDNITASDMELGKFVSYDGTFYGEYAPFNSVLCEDENGRVFLFKRENVEFFLRQISYQGNQSIMDS